jgi:hypothetical protein
MLPELPLRWTFCEECLPLAWTLPSQGQDPPGPHHTVGVWSCVGASRDHGYVQCACFTPLGLHLPSIIYLATVVNNSNVSHAFSVTRPLPREVIWAPPSLGQVPKHTHTHTPTLTHTHPHTHTHTHAHTFVHCHPHTSTDTKKHM